MKRKTTQSPSARSKEIRVSCRAPQALVERIDTVAEAKGISASDIVRMALKIGLPELEKQPA